MPFSISLAEYEHKRTLAVVFALTSLIPLLIMIYVLVEYALPYLNAYQKTGLTVVFVYCLSAMFLVSLLGFLLIARSMAALSNLTSIFRSKSIRSFDAEQEEESLGNSFYTIFQTATGRSGKHRLSVDSMSTFIDVASALTSELEFDRLFPLIISKITEAMSAERTSLYVIDQEKDELWTKVAEQVDDEIRVPIGDGISGRVAESGETINVVDAWELSYYNRDFDIKNQFRTRSVLCVPIKNRAGDIIGVIQVMNKKGKKRFNAEDETFLKDLTSQAGIALENSLLIDEVMLSFNSSISTLSATVDARHPFTAGHSERVNEYSLLIARQMGMDEEKLEVLKFAGLLHDIGKIGIRDDVLMKNGQFTREERSEMETHPAKTKSILEKFRFPKALQQVPEIAVHHHERIDGTGYPDGLIGDHLPLGSKILAVADVFDALTSRRDYPKYADEEVFSSDPMPLSKAISILKDGSGSQFDPEIVAAFMKILPKALQLYRGSHFEPEYVDDVIRSRDSDGNRGVLSNRGR